MIAKPFPSVQTFSCIGCMKLNNHMYKLQDDPNKRSGISKMLAASKGSISQPGKDPICEFESKVVYRHIQDGDIVLVNRQV